MTVGPTTTVHLLCAGAVQGLVKALQPRFEREHGATLQARYGAVGALKEALLAGEPCDAMIATDAMVAALQSAGDLAAAPRAPLGRVRTGIAVPAAAPRPAIASPDELKAALLAASAVYFPDPQRATAGIHFASVLDRLGIAAALAARLRTFPNGATSMRELAGADAGAIGCTQITEIVYTPGVALVGGLPAAFELATVYSAGVAARSAQPALAARLIALLTDDDSRALRVEGGFEFD